MTSRFMTAWRRTSKAVLRCDRYYDAEWSPASDVLALSQGDADGDGEPPHLQLLRIDGSLRDLGAGMIPVAVGNDWRPGPPQDR